MILKSLKYMSAAVLMALAGSAWSDCACFCVSGELQTMCTTVAEAQADTTSCPSYSAQSCPEEPGSATASTYDSPEEGAVNCRDVRVFDALRGRFVDVKACDVLEAS